MTEVTPPPRISVIMPVRNGARFIAQALESIQRQTRRPDEVIVVDGHSIDGTREIVSRFPGIRWLPQSGKGVPDAYNCGIAVATGDFIALLEHDDLWLPEKLERQLARMVARPELLYTLTHAQLFLEPGCVMPPGYPEDALTRPLASSILSTFMARRGAFDAIGKFDDSYLCAGDVDWFARAKDLQAPMEILPETLARKRLHDHNYSVNYAGNNLELLRLAQASIARQRKQPSAS